MCAHVCAGQSNERLCSTWLSDAWSLLSGLSSLVSHNANIPLPSYPSTLSHSTFYSQYTQGIGGGGLLFFVSNLCTAPALLLFLLDLPSTD